MQEKENRFLNLTVILAVIPAYIYFCSFTYETGICSRFNIPKYLISPNLTTILIFATSIWTILFSSLKMLGLSTSFFKPISNESKKHLRPIRFANGVVIIIAVLMFFTYPLSWTLLWVLLGVAFFLNLITWGFPIIYFVERKKKVSEKLLEIQASKPTKTDLLDYVFEYLNTKERIFVMILIVIPFISFFIGDGEALKQTHFQIIPEKNNVLVLRKYDDLFICSPYNKTKKELEDSLILIKLSDKELILKTVNTGRLVTRLTQ